MKQFFFFNWPPHERLIICLNLIKLERIVQKNSAKGCDVLKVALLH